MSVCLSVCVQGAAEHSSQLPGAHCLPQAVNNPPETAPGVLQAPLCLPEFLFGVRCRALEPRSGCAAGTGAVGAVQGSGALHVRCLHFSPSPNTLGPSNPSLSPSALSLAVSVPCSARAAAAQGQWALSEPRPVSQQWQWDFINFGI